MYAFVKWRRLTPHHPRWLKIIAAKATVESTAIPYCVLYCIEIVRQTNCGKRYVIFCLRVLLRLGASVLMCPNNAYHHWLIMLLCIFVFSFYGGLFCTCLFVLTRVRMCICVRLVVQQTLYKVMAATQAL